MKKLLGFIGALFAIFTLNCAVSPQHTEDDYAEKVIVDGISAMSIIERLEKHIDLLYTFNAKNKKMHVLIFGTIDKFPIFFNQTEETYKHELINLCIKKMKKEMSLDPLFEAWRLFNDSFKTVDDGLFLKEFSIIIGYLYKNLLFEFDTHRLTSLDGPVTQKLSLAQLVDFCNKISTLPIPEILRLLDRCYLQFVTIMQEYGLGSGTSWQKWLWEYWWIPPAIICAVIYSIYSRYVTTPQFSSFGYGGGFNSFGVSDPFLTLRDKA